MKPKQTIITLMVIFGIAVSNVMGQASKKQPSIMVMPQDNWCIEQGYYNTVENPETGKKKKVPDYKEAFQESQDVGLAISKIGEIFSDRGFPLKDMEQRLKNIEEEKALDEVEEGGRGTKKTLKEKLLNKAKADIILYLNWDVNKQGPYKRVTFQLDAIDPYTAEQVGAASGTGPKNTGSLDVLLEEAVLENVTNLQSQMQEYFNDLNENGRKIKMRIKISNSSNLTLKDYCSSSEQFQIGQMFKDAVRYFQKQNESVSQNFRTGGLKTNTLNFKMIRIPMFYERESAFGGGKTKVAMNATNFSEKIKTLVAKKCDALEKENIKVTGIGLGEASLTIVG